MEFVFHTRRQELISGPDGANAWRVIEEPLALEPDRAAVLISDMWDRHWSAGATRRAQVLAQHINRSTACLRERGFHIIHAPSDTMEFYAEHPARKRLLAVREAIEPYDTQEIPACPPLPVDASDGGSDTPELDEFPPNTRVWTRQNPCIFIDEGRDILCGDEGALLHTWLRRNDIQTLLYIGVHTNMCVLNRSFGIRPMRANGMQTLLARDLTDCMYNPARAPYVSHEEGLRLVIEYIEKFHCPTVELRKEIS